MELYLAISLSFLETTFIVLSILLLHFIRNRIGSAAFYITIGALFVFIQFISVTQLKVIVGYSGGDFYIANSVLFLPLLAAVMVIYITEGTQATQKLIVGTLAFFGFYIYLCYTTSTQCTWNGFRITQGPTATTLNYFIGQSLKNMTGTLVALCLDLFLIPILYQRFINLGARKFFSILGALMLTQFFDSFVSITISYWNNPLWLDQISSTYIARVIATIWISILITVYIKYIEEGVTHEEERKAFDIIFAFMGSYRKTKALEQNLLEWEGRYRMVVENASDMILIADKDGKILDVNKATVSTLNYDEKEDLIGESFLNLSNIFKTTPFIWKRIWEHNKDSNIKNEGQIETKQIIFKTKEGSSVEVDAAFSKAFLKKKTVMLVFGRNITERNKLIKEKSELKEQLYHTQRVESLGRLAGGVSHEFNNILHAIQGHIDTTLIFGNIEGESDKKHLESVMELVNKASGITSQLLGFARKREFKDKIIDLRKVLEDTKKMFMPMVKSEIQLVLNNPEYECMVKADPVQLEQVFLNLLINAMDALKNKDEENKLIKVNLERNKTFPDNWKPLKTDAVPENYYVITVEDNGEGMEKKTVNKIFEPFFTTKEVGKGTGMGLAMVYGEITNYKGLLYVKSEKHTGTVFYVFLPVMKGENE
ncbi:MAG: PAS domain S-box protein [Victivallales bacterium]|nr:PAS domain S-box protein [Victivallales bacterium]MCF7888682.1 PAS domain S-box protein [Victivallales bacterium]